MFPTIDPSPVKDGVGHWVVVSLDIPKKCFHYFDSLYDAKRQAGWDIFERMVKNIKALWNAAAAEDSRDEPLSPLTLDHFKTYYMRTPMQNNGLVVYSVLLHFTCTSLCFSPCTSYLFNPSLLLVVTPSFVASFVNRFS